MDAYLDIETTGLSSRYCDITVVGVCLCHGGSVKLVQLVGDDVTGDNLLQALDGVATIYTYNGSRFDLPFMRDRLGVDFTGILHHHDLMYDCWRNNLYGGFKAVETQLRIPRRLKGISGLDAVTLWWRYHNDGDREALALLLEYNKEDVLNLVALRERLSV